jgi:uncharacterized protein YcfJ
MKKIITITIVAILGFNTISAFAMNDNFVSYTQIVKASPMAQK